MNFDWSYLRFSVAKVSIPGFVGEEFISTSGFVLLGDDLTLISFPVSRVAVFEPVFHWIICQTSIIILTTRRTTTSPMITGKSVFAVSPVRARSRIMFSWFEVTSSNLSSKRDRMSLMSTKCSRTVSASFLSHSGLLSEWDSYFEIWKEKILFVKKKLIFSDSYLEFCSLS